MAQKKEYRSALRSRRMIRQAFQELLLEKPFEKITVTDIVNRADINRSTFYAHYPDVRGLVEQIIHEVLDATTLLLSSTSFQDIVSNPDPFLRELLNIGGENMELYRLMGQTEFSLRNMEALKQSFVNQALSAADIPEHVRSSTTFQIQINFFIGGILNTYMQWLTGTLDCSTEDIVEEISRIIRDTSHFYLDLI